MKTKNQLMLALALCTALAGCNRNGGSDEQEASPPALSEEMKAQVGQFKTLELYSSIPYCGNDNLSQAFYIIQYEAFFICKKNSSHHYWQMLNLKGEKGEKGKDTFVKDVGQAVLQVDLSKSHSCALLSNNSVFCWGDNSTGQIDNSKKAEIPAFQQSVGNTFVKGKKVATGNGDTCAITMDDKVKCWGHSDPAKGGSGIDYNATTHIGDLHEVTELQAGENHYCAIGKGTNGSTANAKGVFCWGKNDKGQLGTPSSTVASSLIPIYTNVDATKLSLGHDITCGVEKGTKGAFCFGTNASNQMGLGTGNRADERPLTWAGDTQLNGTKTAVFDIQAGKDAVCMTYVVQLYCAGKNTDNLLVDRNDEYVETFFPPQYINTYGAGAPKHFAVADGTLCYSPYRNKLTCRSMNGSGQLRTDRVFARVGSEELSENSRGVVLGANNACEVLPNSTLICWGGNELGKTALNAAYYRKNVYTPETFVFPRDPNTPNVLR